MIQTALGFRNTMRFDPYLGVLRKSILKLW